MRRRHEQIDSPAMGRPVHLWCYGHFGAPVIAFPTAAGFAHEWERQGMVEALAPLLYAGKIKLYCPESNVAESWTRREGEHDWRMGRHRAYESFVVDTLVPLVSRDCGGERRIAVAGASLGAYYAANFALKRPDLFHYALCLSGRYDMRSFTDGQTSADLYFNSPLAYVPGLAGEALERVRRQTHLTLVCGRGKWEEGCIEETAALGHLLRHKGVSCHVDFWGHDVSHDWVWWHRQAFFHLSRTFR